MTAAADKRMLQCAICGKMAERTGKRQKYCPECARSEAQRRGMLRSERRRQATKEKMVRREQKKIKICLECTKRYCTGICERFRG